MKFKYIRAAIFIVSAFVCNMSSASDFLTINDFSKIKWQLSADGNVYFRNIQEFDSSYLGCCHNYYIDMSGDVGKAMFSSFLALHMAGKPGQIGVINKTQAGPINYIGNW